MRHEAPGSSNTFNRFTQFKPFNPPDLIRGPFKTFSIQRDELAAVIVIRLVFVENVRNQLGFKAAHRELIEVQGSYVRREPAAAYAGKFVGEKAALSSENALVWDETVEDPAT